MSGNTAIATTATADRPYVGRFAPSPTGRLHLGSLVAAVGSFLDARHHGGRWLVRIEDLDTARVIPGAADDILRALEACGLAWDGAVLYQSRRTDAYAEAMHQLRALGRTYECSCSRRDLAESDATGYPGTCRERSRHHGPTSTRFRVDDREVVAFEDGFQGSCEFALDACGDVVIRRKDGGYSYQLAVVVDDAQQSITHVIRGVDLLPSTAWQIALQRELRLPPVHYGHLPLVVEPGGAKLAKSRRSVAIATSATNTAIAADLVLALSLLGHTPPDDLTRDRPLRLLQWASEQWQPRVFHGRRTLLAPM